MAASVRFAGAVTNNGVPVEGTVTVTTTTAAGVSCPLSSTGRFSVSVSVATGDTVTLKVDCGEVFTATSILGGVPVTGRPVDLSCDISSGSITLQRFV